MIGNNQEIDLIKDVQRPGTVEEITQYAIYMFHHPERSGRIRRAEVPRMVRLFEIPHNQMRAFRFGAAMPFDGGAYGDGVMTRDDILRSERFVLPQAGGAEPRALVIVETEDYVFAATHLDHVSAAAQHEQVRAIDSLVARFVAGVRKPVFLAGDMNATPDSETLRLFRQRWRLLTPTDGGTYPSDPPRECIDYIFAWRDGVPCEVIEARVLNRSGAGDLRRASDHLPVLLEVAWQPAGL